MSEQGWHLNKMVGIFYQFQKGSNKKYDYEINMESKFDEEMNSIFEAAGWKAIIIYDGWQILRAEEGTLSIFSDHESKVEVLTKSKKSNGKLAIIFFIISMILLMITLYTQALAMSILFYIAVVLFIFTFLPYLGVSRTIYKLKRK